MKISLVVSTYNQPISLGKVLNGISRQSRLPDEILIADDGSGDETRHLIDTWRPTVSVPVHHLWHEDQGFRKTVILNEALRVVAGEYLILLDGDCVPHRHFVADHEQLAEKGFWVQGRRCFVRKDFVPEFDLGRMPIWRWFIGGRLKGIMKGVRLPFPIIQRETKQRGIIGCNMSFWREDLFAVNGFDESYSGWGIGEDSDLGTRLYHLGRPRKLVHGRAIVFHLNHPSLPKNHVAESLAKLDETIRSRRIRCDQGLDRHVGVRQA